MGEEITIAKEIEKAIITCLSDGKRLLSREIAECVFNYVNRNNKNNLYRKIQRMAYKGYLLHTTAKDGDYVYYLNPEIKFILEGPPLKLLKDPGEGATSAQVAHSSALKDVIKNWMSNLSEPYPGYPTVDSASSLVIAACESLMLFPDLENHLPPLGTDVCQRWNEYKRELLELDELKQDLFSSLQTEVLKCFEGLDLRFIYEEVDYLADYECRLNPLNLYDLVLRLYLGMEGHDHHMRFFSWLENNAPFVKKDDQVLWGDYLQVPKKDRALLEAGVSRFLAFFEDIPGSQFVKMVGEINEKVEKLKPERQYILSELERILHYASFPGECQYLS